MRGVYLEKPLKDMCKLALRLDVLFLSGFIDAVSADHLAVRISSQGVSMSDTRDPPLEPCPAVDKAVVRLLRVNLTKR